MRRQETRGPQPAAGAQKNRRARHGGREEHPGRGQGHGHPVAVAARGQGEDRRGQEDEGQIGDEEGGRHGAATQPRQGKGGR